MVIHLNIVQREENPHKTLRPLARIDKKYPPPMAFNPRIFEEMLYRVDSYKIKEILNMTNENFIKKFSEPVWGIWGIALGLSVGIGYLFSSGAKALMDLAKIENKSFCTVFEYAAFFTPYLITAALGPAALAGGAIAAIAGTGLYFTNWLPRLYQLETNSSYNLSVQDRAKNLFLQEKPETLPLKIASYVGNILLSPLTNLVTPQEYTDRIKNQDRQIILSFCEKLGNLASKVPHHTSKTNNIDAITVRITLKELFSTQEGKDYFYHMINFIRVSKINESMPSLNPLLELKIENPQITPELIHSFTAMVANNNLKELSKGLESEAVVTFIFGGWKGKSEQVI